MTERLPDWRPRLTAYLSAASSRPFEEGVHDCALFAGGAVEAITGTDYAAAWRGRYSSVPDGLKALRHAGHLDHVELVASLLPEICWNEAQAGDVVAVEAEGLAALGIVQGGMVYVLRQDGIGLVPLSTIRRAFRVG